MKALELATSDVDVKLIEPDIERDAPLGVQWLAGESGRNTLELMAVAPANNKPTSLYHEKARVRDFIEKDDQLNWMIESKKRVVGAVWVDLCTVGTLPAPSVHIMIGDTSDRGKGIGRTVISAVITYLKEQGYDTVYSRHLSKNHVIQRLFIQLGFQELDAAYVDEDGLEFQNVKKNL